LKKIIINFKFLFQLAQIIFDDSLNHTTELDSLFGTFFLANKNAVGGGERGVNVIDFNENLSECSQP
jgi:hypothetical protein